jgi:hypothetical protein
MEQDDPYVLDIISLMTTIIDRRIKEENEYKVSPQDVSMLLNGLKNKNGKEVLQLLSLMSTIVKGSIVKGSVFTALSLSKRCILL